MVMHNRRKDMSKEKAAKTTDSGSLMQRSWNKPNQVNKEVRPASSNENIHDPRLLRAHLVKKGLPTSSRQKIMHLDSRELWSTRELAGKGLRTGPQVVDDVNDPRDSRIVGNARKSNVPQSQPSSESDHPVEIAEPQICSENSHCDEGLDLQGSYQSPCSSISQGSYQSPLPTINSMVDSVAPAGTNNLSGHYSTKVVEDFCFPVNFFCDGTDFERGNSLAATTSASEEPDLFLDYVCSVHGYNDAVYDFMFLDALNEPITETGGIVKSDEILQPLDRTLPSETFVPSPLDQNLQGEAPVPSSLGRALRSEASVSASLKRTSRSDASVPSSLTRTSRTLRSEASVSSSLNRTSRSVASAPSAFNRNSRRAPERTTAPPNTLQTPSNSPPLQPSRGSQATVISYTTQKTSKTKQPEIRTSRSFLASFGRRHGKQSRTSKSK